MKKRLSYLPLKKQMIFLVIITVIPFVIIALYMLYAMVNYSQAYQSIVSNISVANQYSQEFKSEMDENIYRIVVSGKTFEEIEDDPDLQDPYAAIGDMKDTLSGLVSVTVDENSRTWLQIIMRNLGTLTERLDDIRISMAEGGNYDENIEMLNNNIYILTELIEDDIHTYIYYQVQYMDAMRVELSKRVVSFITYMIILMAAVIVAAARVTSKMSENMVTPIKDLSRVTHEIASGNFSARAAVRGSVDVQQLGNSVNDMAGHLEVMVAQIREDERKMRQADLRLLQEQINPHFLYNSLDAIVWLIEDGKSEKAEDMVISLSNFFRLSLSHGREFISIRDEESHIRSYLEVQKVRYSDILNYEIDIDPSLYQYRIMKLTLQPLVENALYHGVKNKRKGGTIRISGYREGSLIRLCVEDNGAGMDEEQLQRLKEDMKKPSAEASSGFGMANVNERIRMNFGPAYGLYLESEKGVGTKVIVTIPAEPLDSAGGGTEDKKAAGGGQNRVEEKADK